LQIENKSVKETLSLWMLLGRALPGPPSPTAGEKGSAFDIGHSAHLLFLLSLFFLQLGKTGKEESTE